MSKLLKDNKELMKEYNFKKNKGIDLKKLTCGSNKKVCWKCSKNHEWADSPNHRVNGRNCPICSNHSILKGYNDLATTDPKLIQEWDYKKNMNLKPTEVTRGSAKKVWWICNKGHSYEQAINLKSKGYGCPICTNKRVLKGYNDLSTINPKLASEWDYDNNSITPEEVTDGSGKKVWWICPKCKNSYESTVANRNSGTGCPYCAGKKVKIGFNDLKTWCENNNRSDLIEEFDYKKNDFNITEITVGCGKKIWFKCPNGHSYRTTLNSRINNGTGCGICGHKVFKKGENDLLTTHPEIAKEWDYDKNKVAPNEVMAGSNKKYWFICPKGHSYLSSLGNRKKGQNCPQCNVEKHTSFPEKAITFYLKKFFKKVEESYHNSFLGYKEIDIYLPELKFGIEYDGFAWHKDYKRDLSKDEVCSKNGITLLRVRESGCKDYKSDSIKKYIAVHNTQELNNAIIFIFNCLNEKYKLHINADIDVNRDRIKIMELMNLTEKKNSIANYCPVIKEFWNYEKNGKITPEQISHSSVKKINLKCSNGHKWEMIAREFILHPYCPYCNGRKVWPGFNDLFTTNPELKILWSPNNTIDPKTIKKGSNKKVLWICQNCGKEYEMAVNSKKGKFCRECSHKKKN